MPIQPKQQPPYYTANSNIKTYQGLITQSSTNPPTIIELINTLGETPIKQYTGTGEYYIVITGQFPEDKTTFNIQNNVELQTELTMYWVDIHTIGIGTGVANTPANGKLSKTPFTIIVHP